MVQSAGTILISLIREEGIPDERIEQSTRSLLRDLNESAPGSASYPPSTPAPKGSMAGDLSSTMQIVLTLSSIVSTLAVPVIAHWLARQQVATGLRLSGIDQNGNTFEVTISPGTPANVVHQLAGAVMNGASS